MKYKLPSQDNHIGLLKKIQSLKGKILVGRDLIKGPEGKGFPPDNLVSNKYYLHDLIRGFYKPKGLDYLLSYQSTGEYKSETGPIFWANSDQTEFDYIEMWPPNKPKDTRKKSDIEAARKNLTDEIPLGIFLKTSKGQNLCLGLGIITEERTDGCFIVRPIDIKINQINNQNLSDFERNYFSFNSKWTEIEIVSPNMEDFDFDNIYINESKTSQGDIVFYTQHGDNPTWNAGLSAICRIKEGPHSKGYEDSAPKYFKVTLETLYKLPRVLDRSDFIGYFNCYDIPFIGPKLKNEANQANQLITVQQAKHIVGVLLDYFPEDHLKIIELFGENFGIPKQKASIPNNVNPPNDFWSLPLDSANKDVDHPKNLILYGAPGTGKSYELNKRVISNFPSEQLHTRVTFHPNYTYRNFVGTYKPSPLYKDSEAALYGSKETNELETRREPIIDYIFEAGPFLKSYLKAYHNPNHNFVLIIEELNRANAPAVFGELFQLLDREEDGESTYSVRLEEATMKYLKENGVNAEEIKMPKNLYLWATMNNSDQGVLPLDGAFKRRWSFEHIGLNENEKNIVEHNIKFKFIPAGKQLNWNQFRRKLNDYLVDILKIHEDKLIAPFFLNKKELENEDAIKNKLLLYLKEDILKYKDGLFKYPTFSKICEKYNDSKEVFIDDFDLNAIYTDKQDDPKI